MIVKRTLNDIDDFQEWHDYISERFKKIAIICGDTETPMEYPCIVSWYENEAYNFCYSDDDICAYNFIYLSDFNTN